MIFGPTPLEEARGAILAHTIRLTGKVLKKGTVLDQAAIAALQAGGHGSVIAARLEPGETRTLPLAIYSFMHRPGGEAAALRLALLSMALKPPSTRLLSMWCVFRWFCRWDCCCGLRVMKVLLRLHAAAAVSLDARARAGGRGGGTNLKQARRCACWQRP